MGRDRVGKHEVDRAPATGVASVVLGSGLCNTDGIDEHARTMLEGFSIEQWASHARKKSSIASSVCRLNGELKKKLAMLQEADPLIYADPWLNAKAGLPRKIIDDDVFEDAWAGWRPSSVQCESVPDSLVVEHLMRDDIGEYAPIGSACSKHHCTALDLSAEEGTSFVTVQLARNDCTDTSADHAEGHRFAQSG